jgi:hypothetical protein
VTTSSQTTGEKPPAMSPEMSPVRSMAAVSLGFGLFTQILGRVGATALAALLPGAFPQQPDADVVVIPSDIGLMAMMAMTFANATLAGLITGRVARFMPVLHALVLAGILGLFGATSMDQVRGFPGWFAIGYLALPALGAALGGVLARRTEKKAKTFVSETVVSRDSRSETD